VLELLGERPMHPYEMKQTMQERGMYRAIPLKQASIYDTVERLTRAGFIESVETNREGRRPERTIYRLTLSGSDELDIWLRQLLEQPTREYPHFGAALMFLGALRYKQDAIIVFEHRITALESEIASVDGILREVPADLPRLFIIEDDYAQAMRRAELEWLRRIITELKDGSLDWPRVLEMQERPMAPPIEKESPREQHS
jgi:DNA-binding PadR family transcriptional regulator